MSTSLKQSKHPALKTFEEEQAVSESKLYMLRCMVAMAHADNVLHEKEREYIIQLAGNLPLNEDQLQILLEDLYVPQSLEVLLPHITELKFIGQLTYFARLMAYKDGNFSLSEKEFLNKLADYQTENASRYIRKSAMKMADQELVLHDITIKDNRAFRSGKRITWFELQNEILEQADNINIEDK